MRGEVEDTTGDQPVPLDAMEELLVAVQLEGPLGHRHDFVVRPVAQQRVDRIQQRMVARRQLHLRKPGQLRHPRLRPRPGACGAGERRTVDPPGQRRVRGVVPSALSNGQPRQAASYQLIGGIREHLTSAGEQGRLQSP